MDQHPKQGVPALSWQWEDGRIAEIIYRHAERSTTFAVWDGAAVSIESELALPSGDRLVPFSPNNNLIKNEVVALPSDALEYGTEQDLIEDIAAFIRRYLEVSEHFERIASYYVLLTWVYDAFKELPYLRFQGDYGTGKTRALLTVGSLCYKAFFASGASTVSPIFHILDAFRGTLIFDEADFRFSDEKAEVVKILNNGNVDGLPVLRTIQNRQREFNPQAFKVFGPKIVAMRGGYEDRALESRFLTETMGARGLRSDIPINLPDEHRLEALALRNKLLLFRFRSRSAAKLNPAYVNPALEPRLNQILVPLLSVIKDDKLRGEISAMGADMQRSLLDDRGQSVEAQVLEVLIELMARGETGPVTLHEINITLAERYGAEFERPVTNRWLGSIVRKRLGITTYKSNGVFAVPMTEREKIEHLARRYGVSRADTDPPE